MHHTAEVLTPLTNFRVHPVYSWIFANILAAVDGDRQRPRQLHVRRNRLSICALRHQHHPGAVHPHLRPPAALAHVDFLPRRARAHFHFARASPGAPLRQSPALQQEFRQLSRAVGLDVRHALRAGEAEREPLAFRLCRSSRCAHRQGRAGGAAGQRRAASQAAMAPARHCRRAGGRTQELEISGPGGPSPRPR